MPEAGDAQPQAQNPTVAALQLKLNQERHCIGRETWQTRSVAIWKFCNGNETILMRSTYSKSLLVKHGEPSGELF